MKTRFVCHRASPRQMYTADILASSSKGEAICWSSFTEMWKKHFKNVIIPKENKFTKCGVCTLLKYRLLKTRDSEEKNSLAEKRKIHLSQQSAERDHYYGNQLKAEQEPQKFLSVIIDGMDQAKTNIPHVINISKTEPSHFLKTHVTGVISHGQSRVMCFVDLLQWKHDSNLTMNVLLQVFTKLSENGCLPECLFLQMDNCYRENKNKYLMAFAAYLVEKEIFKEVYMSFLMVGHTHEDVDQVFSRVAVKLKKRNVMTVPELHTTIRESYTHQPETFDLECVFDISAWLEGHIATIRNHVYPHAFKFFLGKDGKAKMVYKNWAQDKLWQPTTGEPLTILPTLPNGIPKLIPPYLAGKESTSPSDLRSKLKGSSHRMSEEQLQWWESFIRREEDIRAEWEGRTEKETIALEEEKWTLQHLTKYNAKTKKNKPADPATERQERELERLLTKENSFPPIQVRNKKRRAPQQKAQEQKENVQRKDVNKPRSSKRAKK